MEKRSWVADELEEENVPRSRKIADGFSFESLYFYFYFWFTFCLRVVCNSYMPSS
jgi:hypothetical protein